jgi:copper resistance protein B
MYRVAACLAAFVVGVSTAAAQSPAISDEDRRAAFPEVSDHTVHDSETHFMLLGDQVEWHTGDGHVGINWDTKGWIGGDRNRFSFRSEGRREDGRVDNSQTDLLYARMIGRWWELVAGVRQDLRPGDPETWGAIGVQGLAPYWLEVEATAYVGRFGRTRFRLELEHELLLTNHLVLQPQIEMEISGKAEPEHALGAGLNTIDSGIRLRYEIRREVAPYVGLSWKQRFFGTADLAKAAHDQTSGARLVIGLRAWM